jgi:hypothetical protein
LEDSCIWQSCDRGEGRSSLHHQNSLFCSMTHLFCSHCFRPSNHGAPGRKNNTRICSCQNQRSLNPSSKLTGLDCW